MKKLVIIVAFLLSIFSVNSQAIFPENGPLYKDDVVPRIDITINPDTLNWLYQEENLESDIEFSARFIFDNGEVRDTIEPVGFRLRGNTSRHSQKKSFKVSFNTFESGANYYGVEKLNLNGEHNDPSIIRSKVCWDIFRKIGIPAPRANHVQIYINGDYYGLYINVEHIDEEFVKSRFTYNNGNLYKCLYPANLQYIGDDPELYKFENNGHRTYELKINEIKDDYSDIANFIDVLNNNPNSSLKCNLDEVFNQYDYLKVIAADVLFGNWDGYIYNQNNYYLYHNSIYDKFEFIPYDLDNTLGIDWMGRDWGTRDMYDWQNHGDYRPLYERVMGNEELRNQYTFFMHEIVYNILDYDSLKTAIEQRRNMIVPYVENDPYYPLDYGYSIDNFYSSYNSSVGGHVNYGLFPYLETRINSIKNQLENTNMLPIIKYISHKRLSTTNIRFNAMAVAQTNSMQVELEYTIEGQNLNSVSMFDDGMHDDGEANDGYYGITLFDLPSDLSLSYQIKVEDNLQASNIMPCEPVIVPSSGGSNFVLYINEFMADNDNTIADEHGNYDDWFELYNPEGETVWLGDKYMTDDLSEPNKWQMPDAYIEPGGFVLVWADDETDEGPFHANFKLSKGGEEIGLYYNDLSVIDEIVFGEQSTDVSFGREKDGDPNWIFFEQSTPLASNQTSAVAEIVEGKGFVVYPNPADGNFVYFSEKLNYRVFDIYGRLLDKGANSNSLNISGLSKGIYIVVTDDGFKQKLIVN